MNQDEVLQQILEKLISLEQGQVNLKEELKKEIQENRQAIRELQSDVQENRAAIRELQSDVQENRTAIRELQSDAQEIKQGMRFYDFKLLEHEKQIFKLKS